MLRLGFILLANILLGELLLLELGSAESLLELKHGRLGGRLRSGGRLDLLGLVVGGNSKLLAFIVITIANAKVGTLLLGGNHAGQMSVVNLISLSHRLDVILDGSEPVLRLDHLRRVHLLAEFLLSVGNTLHDLGVLVVFLMEEVVGSELTLRSLLRGNLVVLLQESHLSVEILMLVSTEALRESRLGLLSEVVEHLLFSVLLVMLRLSLQSTGKSGLLSVDHDGLVSASRWFPLGAWPFSLRSRRLCRRSSIILLSELGLFLLLDLGFLSVGVIGLVVAIMMLMMVVVMMLLLVFL